jgi:glucosamine--fructose-6-phosphate aminotransferase (isomerizing)
VRHEGVGIAGTRDVAPVILEALKRLEYRGYDSAGIATLQDGKISRRRSPGKLNNLGAVLDHKPLAGHTGIGHTRWATHGAPTESNAHPHATGRVAIVHNGIIENFRELKAELEAKGHTFESETDSEVAAHLVTDYLAQGLLPDEAAKQAVARLTGAYSIAMIFKDHEGLLIGARKGAPLAVGHAETEAYIGSDAFALAPFTNRVTYLEEGDVVVIRGPRFRFSISPAVPPIARSRSPRLPPRWSTRPATITSWPRKSTNSPKWWAIRWRIISIRPGRGAQAGRGPAPRSGQGVAPDHLAPAAPPFMPAWSANTGSRSWAAWRWKSMWRRNCATAIRSIPKMAWRCSSPSRARPPTRWRRCATPRPRARPPSRWSMSPKAPSPAKPISCCRPMPGRKSASPRPRPSPASLAALASFAIAAGVARGNLSAEDEKKLCASLLEAPRHIAEFLKQEPAIKLVAEEIAKARDVLYMGRGPSYPLALEGALKLKEISYIHAEGYAAGEMKHGPIALIDEAVPIIVIAPHDSHFEKTISNMQEVMARGGKVLLISDAEGISKAGKVWASITVPTTNAFITPLLYAIPVQLLAYYAAIAKGTDVDQPRNLAKSVTVE